MGNYSLKIFPTNSYLVCFKGFRGSLILIPLRSWVSFSRLNCTTVFQLLMPHIQSTLQINITARGTLLATNGAFDKVDWFNFVCKGSGGPNIFVIVIWSNFKWGFVSVL